MKSIILFLFTILVASNIFSQDVSIPQSWKFKTGDDSTSWQTVAFNDADWKSIETRKSWEEQGYTDYNGFAWYRLHINIPSSIKEKAFLKENLRINLGSISNGDEVYLNGKLIGKNSGRPGDIRSARRGGPRVYMVPLNDASIAWDKDNVIAIRVYNGNGPGGLLAGDYGISVVDVIDFVTVNSDSSYLFGSAGKLTKTLLLQSTYDNFDYTGKLHVVIRDPGTNKEILNKTADASFTKTNPFAYTFNTAMPDNKSYNVEYNFVEARTQKHVNKMEGTPYVLTPKASARPRINGADVYGTRASHPFLYKIPATGDKPLQYAVKNLPTGLKLDANTGIITGAVANKGSYKVNLSVKNKLGTDQKDFVIEIGDNIGLTPALGWNSWNAWGLSVSDEKVKISAKAMADHLIDHGWSYINIDDGWEAAARAASGEIVTNEKFPDMKGLSDYVHSLGLKIGIYSSPGPRTCGGFLGSYEHEEQDAKTYGDWGIDYLKYDWCSYGQIAPRNPNLEELKKPYIVMETALHKVNRDIMYSLCQYGTGDVWKWGAEVGGNSWRTTGDITDTWQSLSRIGFTQDKGSRYAEPGHFNDPDMMIVGKVGWGPRLHNSRLSPNEQYTHVSLWSLLASPLLIGCDMGQLDEFTLNMLTNDEVIGINQDALGKQAFKLMDKDSIQVWVKELKNGDKAVGIFNLSNNPMKPQVNFADVKLSAAVNFRDVWRQKDLGKFSNSYTANLPSHGVVFLRASNK